LGEGLSHSEIQELLGAYALGAVDEAEQTIIEGHLVACESCRVELDEHRRLAGILRQHATRVSPLASMESNGSPRTTEDVARARLARRWGVPVAVAIVLLLVGGLFAQGQIRFDDLEARIDRIAVLERAQLAAADPAALVTALRTSAHAPVLTVVSREAGGDSYAMNAALPRLEAGKTYQLWQVDDDGSVTAAVALGRSADVAGFSLSSGVDSFLLTVEEDRAPSQPTLPAVAEARATP